MTHSYPLKLHFRFLALAPRISVKDAQGKEILYIEQKVFALKEAVKVFDNSEDKNLLYTIQANQIIDFGATYMFQLANTHQLIGSIQRDGMRSLVQASYTMFDKNDKPLYKIMQTNPLVAMFDSILSIIPFIELITGFILNPVYTITAKEGEMPVMTMKKKPSFLESEFEIIQNKDLPEGQELLCLLSFLMIVQLERNRG